MPSLLLEVSRDILSIGAILCYLVLSDQQLIIAVVDKVKLPNMLRQPPGYGLKHKKRSKLREFSSIKSDARRNSQNGLQPVEVSRGEEVQTGPKRWDLSSHWNIVALGLAILLPLILALLALGWAGPGNYSKHPIQFSEPLSISVLTIS
jgi:hypothetical protein